MNNATREQLLGYLLGALDEAEQDALERQLRRDPRLRRELSEMREKIQPLEEDEDTQFDFPPPPGLAFRTCQLVAAARSVNKGCECPSLTF